MFWSDQTVTKKGSLIHLFSIIFIFFFNVKIVVFFFTFFMEFARKLKKKKQNKTRAQRHLICSAPYDSYINNSERWIKSSAQFEKKILKTTYLTLLAQILLQVANVIELQVHAEISIINSVKIVLSKLLMQTIRQGKDNSDIHFSTILETLYMFSNDT